MFGIISCLMKFFLENINQSNNFLDVYLWEIFGVEYNSVMIGLGQFE